MNAGLISERDFDTVWGAYAADNGNLFQYHEVADADPHTVWTIIDSGDDNDGNWYALPGFHLVNRLGYVRTVRPWETGLEEALWFEDDLN